MPNQVFVEHVMANATSFFSIHNRNKLDQITVSTLIDIISNDQNYNGPVISKLQYANEIIVDFKRHLIVYDIGVGNLQGKIFAFRKVYKI